MTISVDPSIAVKASRPKIGPASLAVRSSTIPGAGLGLFAEAAIPPFVVLGEYTGVLCDYRDLGEKMQRVGHDELHAFYLGPSLVVDPTDDQGRLLPASLSMAFVNEAPPGREFNLLALYSTPAGSAPAVYFATSCAVRAGSELFVCYGYDYERLYAIAAADLAHDAELRKRVCHEHPSLCADFPLSEIGAPLSGPEPGARSQVAHEELCNSVEEHSASDKSWVVGTEAWRRDLSDVVLPLPVYDSSDSEDDAAAKQQEHGPDYSDVVLPVPVFDSSSESEGEACERKGVEPRQPDKFQVRQEISPQRVLDMMQTSEKHSHRARELHAQPRPRPSPGVASLRRIDVQTAARDLARIMGGSCAIDPTQLSTSAGEPVIVQGLADGWRAMERWSSAAAFAEHYGDMPLKVHELVSVSGMGKGTELWLPARDYIEYAHNTTVDAPFYVFQKKFVSGQHDELFKDYERPMIFADDLWDLSPELRASFAQHRFFCLGGERTGSALHVDPHFTGAWNTLLCGEKRWVLFPPGTPPEVIGVPSELRDRLRTPCAYWWHDWYPRLVADGLGEGLGMREVVQRAGETIYVPAGWWHTVLNHGWTVAVTENQLSPQVLARAWPELLHDRLRARSLARALRSHRPELLPSITGACAGDDLFGCESAQPCHAEVLAGAQGGASYEDDAEFRMW